LTIRALAVKAATKLDNRDTGYARRIDAPSAGDDALRIFRASRLIHSMSPTIQIPSVINLTGFPLCSNHNPIDLIPSGDQRHAVGSDGA
jgi:hypothetical protein